MAEQIEQLMRQVKLGGMAKGWRSGLLIACVSVGVAATPGLDFGSNAPEKHIRFAYTTGVDRLAEAVDRLAHYFGQRG